MSQSYLEMSDEAILAMGKPSAAVVEAAPVVEEVPLVEAETVEEAVVPVVETESSTETTDEVVEDELELSEAELAAAATKGADDNGQVVEDPAPKVKTDKPTTAEPVIDGLPDDAARIFQSFRASGRDVKVRSVDEAIRLMQMGVNYSDKNAEQKPKLAIIKVLEKNGLLDSEKLAFLIDLHNKKPEAIGKLIKDSGIDPLDLDEQVVKDYRPKAQVASDSELEMDDVLAEVKHSPHYDRLLDVVSKKWDDRSKAAAGGNPRVLTMLAEQMENGVYDKIMAEVDHQRMLGGLAGVPVLQAYDDIGKAMNARGEFNVAPKGPVKKLVTAGTKPASTKPEDEQRRRAAAPTKAASAAVKEAPAQSFLGMSDEDFMKTKRN